MPHYKSTCYVIMVKMGIATMSNILVKKFNYALNNADNNANIVFLPTSLSVSLYCW